MKKMRGLFRLIRFELPFSAGICVLLGQLFALEEFASHHLMIAGFVSVFLISASILVLNDYFDVESDKINAPHRPIPSNLVSPKEAMNFSILLLVAGLAFSLSISINALIFSIVLAVIGFLYNRIFKKSGLFGNILVSLSVGLTFIYGGVSVGLPFNKVVIFFGVIASLIDLGEEIAADAMDAEGDKLIGSNSLAIKFCGETALKISGYIFSFVIVLSIIPFILKWFTIIYLIPIAIMDAAIAFSTIRLVKSSNEEGRKYIRTLYLGATFGLIIFLVMKLAGI